MHPQTEVYYTLCIGICQQLYPNGTVVEEPSVVKELEGACEDYDTQLSLVKGKEQMIIYILVMFCIWVVAVVG